jgi:hypothetical protein
LNTQERETTRHHDTKVASWRLLRLIYNTLQEY